MGAPFRMVSCITRHSYNLQDTIWELSGQLCQDGFRARPFDFLWNMSWRTRHSHWTPNVRLEINQSETLISPIFFHWEKMVLISCLIFWLHKDSCVLYFKISSFLSVVKWSTSEFPQDQIHTVAVQTTDTTQVRIFLKRTDRGAHNWAVHLSMCL